ncbi:MAG: pseudouridine synthase [Flavonifractor plautii]
MERGARCLCWAVKGSRNHVKSLLARGQVQVDGAAVRRHDHPLAPGQRVSVLAQGAEARRAPFPVLYEDGRILVIDKPSGLLSMASDREKVRTAYRMAGEYVRRTRPGGRVFIVHRLDRDTSGVLLFAKDRRPSGPIRALGRAGAPPGLSGGGGGPAPREEDTIRTLLRENAAHKVYCPLRRQGGGDPLPHHDGAGVPAGGGHRHRAQDQIRAHLGGWAAPWRAGTTAAASPLGRLCLHAHELALTDPFTGEERTFRSGAPRGFRALVC